VTSKPAFGADQRLFENRVLKLVSRQLPPYPRPTDRPQQQRITRAAEIYLRQCAEIERGTRKRVTWIRLD
jgi:hypothetical protein